MMRFITATVFMAFSQIVTAQSAGQLFENAKLAYENNQYSEAISHLDRCQSALGSSNPRIESLRTLVYYSDNELANAYRSINKYFQMATGQFANTTAHKELVALRLTIQSRLEYMDQVYKGRIERERMQKAEEEVKEMESATQNKLEIQKSESEKVLYTIYSKADNPEDLKQYVAFFGESGQSKKIKQKADYLSFVQSGDKSFNQELYSKALGSYNKAYAIFKSDSIYKKILLTTEEVDYQTAVNTAELKNYEVYYRKYPKGKYVRVVSNTLAKYHLQEVTKSVKGKKYTSVPDQLSEAEKYLENAAPSFGTEYFKTQLNAAKVMESDGNLIKKNKNYSELVRNYYHNYLANTPKADATIKKHLDKINRQHRRIFGHGDNYALFSLRADQEAFAGFDLGSLNHRGLGFLLTGRMNPHVAENDANGDGSVYYAGKTKARYITAYGNIALTHKIVHPVWLYAGGGIASYAKVEDVPGTDDGSKMVLTKNQLMPNAEGGIYIGLKPIVLSVGVSMPVFSKDQKVLLKIQEPLFVPNISVGIVF